MPLVDAMRDDPTRYEPFDLPPSNAQCVWSDVLRLRLVNDVGDVEPGVINAAGQRPGPGETGG